MAAVGQDYYLPMEDVETFLNSDPSVCRWPRTTSLLMLAKDESGKVITFHSAADQVFYGGLNVAEKAVKKLEKEISHVEIKKVIFIMNYSPCQSSKKAIIKFCNDNQDRIISFHIYYAKYHDALEDLILHPGEQIKIHNIHGGYWKSLILAKCPFTDFEPFWQGKAEHVKDWEKTMAEVFTLRGLPDFYKSKEFLNARKQCDDDNNSKEIGESVNYDYIAKKAADGLQITENHCLSEEEVKIFLAAEHKGCQVQQQTILLMMAKNGLGHAIQFKSGEFYSKFYGEIGGKEGNIFAEEQALSKLEKMVNHMKISEIMFIMNYSPCSEPEQCIQFCKDNPDVRFKIYYAGVHTNRKNTLEMLINHQQIQIQNIHGDYWKSLILAKDPVTDLEPFWHITYWGQSMKQVLTNRGFSNYKIKNLKGEDESILSEKFLATRKACDDEISRWIELTGDYCLSEEDVKICLTTTLAWYMWPKTTCLLMLAKNESDEVITFDSADQMFYQGRHAEYYALMKLEKEITRMKLKQVLFIINYSPCSSCTKLITNFCDKNPVITFKIYFAGLYVTRDDDGRVNLKTLIKHQQIKIQNINGSYWKSLISAKDPGTDLTPFWDEQPEPVSDWEESLKEALTNRRFAEYTVEKGRRDVSILSEEFVTDRKEFDESMQEIVNATPC